MSLMLNQTTAFSVRLCMPFTGAWVADCDLDLASDQPLPTGKVSLTIGKTTLVGTIDPRGTNHFGEKAQARVVAGGGGWGNILKPQHQHSDAKSGILSSTVLAGIASSIGEVVNDPTPVTYYKDYVVPAGPASHVLDGRDWYVDGKGITQVAQWPILSLGSDADVISYTPELQRAELAADEIVWPGTKITDLRFGTINARDVDQTFDKAGSRVLVWHTTSTQSRFGAALQAMVSGFGDQRFLKIYQYRIISQEVSGDHRLNLQAVDSRDGVPDTLPIPVFPGLAGYSAKYTEGALVSLVFFNGDPSMPRVVGFDGSAPIELDFDATTLIKLGANATSMVALSDKCDAEFNKIKNTLLTGATPVGGGAVTFATAYVPASVAAAKVEAE